MVGWDREKVNPGEVSRAISVLFDPDTVVELRALKAPKGGTISGYFDGGHRRELAETACQLSGEAAGVYVTLNPVSRDLLARSNNRAKIFVKHTAGDTDIMARCWFPLDFDPTRPADTSATDAEHEAALNRAKECREWLRQFGFPDPIYADSGNGAHLLYRCDFPNDSGITDLFKRCVETIASKWSDEKVKVDKTVFNPARIWKLYGTLAAKGDSVDDRPHRIAWMLEKPEKIEVVPLEVFDALAGTSSKPAAVKPEVATGDSVFDYVSASGRIDLDLEQWFAKHNVPIRKKKDWNGRVLYETDCPWKTEDTQGKVSVIRHPDGGISAKCFHDKCSDNGWADFRDVYEPDWRKEASPAGFRAIEADDDPHRLARKFLQTNYSHPDGRTLARFQGNWYTWNGAAWQIVQAEGIRTELNRFIKSEFDRLSIQAQMRGESKTTARQVKRAVTNNVEDALHIWTQIAANITQPTWVDGEGTWPAAEVLATRNALIHMPSIGKGEKFSIPPTPRFFSTMALDYDFDRNAPDPENWLKFLGQLWPKKEQQPQCSETSDQNGSHNQDQAKPQELDQDEGPEDEADPSENIATLQEWMGYLLTPDTRQQKMLMMVGVPASGKSTIADIITNMVGHDNVASPDLASFAESFGLAPLVGKTVAIIGDARLSGRPDNAQIVSRLLSIVGGDPQQINRKYKEHVSASLKVRFMLISNELPKLADAAAALIRRVLMLRFTRSFADDPDTTLKECLLKELPGILRWAIEGWKRVSQPGFSFKQPQTGKALVNQLKEVISPLTVFIKECCDVGPTYRVPCQDLYDAYVDWATANGKKMPSDSSVFGRDLRACLPDVDKSQPRIDGKKVWCYTGIALKPELVAKVEEARNFKTSCQNR
jgi:P4 family phage/plasmid primase-like protien